MAEHCPIILTDLHNVNFWIKLTVLIIGLCGNITTLIILRKLTKKTSNFILKCLVTSYTMLLCLFFIYIVMKHRYYEHCEDELSPDREYCISTILKISKFGLRISFFQAIWTVVLIAVCQAASIKKPYCVDRIWKKRNVCVGLVVIFVISLLTEIPLYEELNPTINTDKFENSSNINSSSISARTSYDIFYKIVIISFIPIYIMINSLVIMYIDRRKLQKLTFYRFKFQSDTSINPFDRILDNTTETVRLFFTMTLVFVVNASLYFTRELCELIFKDYYEDYWKCWEDFIKDCSHFLLLGNAGSSFFLFAYVKRFRRLLKRLFCQCNSDR